MAVSLTHSSPIYCPTFDILTATEVELFDFGHPVEDLEATYNQVRDTLSVGCELVAVPVFIFAYTLLRRVISTIVEVCVCRENAGTCACGCRGTCYFETNVFL